MNELNKETVADVSYGKLNEEQLKIVREIHRDLFGLGFEEAEQVLKFTYKMLLEWSRDPKRTPNPQKSLTDVIEMVTDAGIWCDHCLFRGFCEDCADDEDIATEYCLVYDIKAHLKRLERLESK